MKILILDKDMITRFDLPSKIEECFLIPYKVKDSNVETKINVDAVDGKWVLKVGGNVNIKNNGIALSSVILTDYSYHVLEIVGQSDCKILYTLPSVEPNMSSLGIYKVNSITIGNNNNCNIFFNHPLIQPNHAVINHAEDGWTVSTTDPAKCLIYINNQRISSSKLKVGDVIFINGLRIVWMDSFIKVNNPNNQVVINGLMTYADVDNESCEAVSPVTDEEASAELYSEDDYFFHTPRLRTSFNEEEVIIDAPPGTFIQEELPFILSIGTSLTMVCTSSLQLYTLYDNISSGTRTIKESIPQIIMCASMIIGSLLIPRVTTAYQKSRNKKKEKKRQQKYTEYVKKREKKIIEIMNHQVQVLNENNPTLEQCARFANSMRTVWARNIGDDDFLTVRLGMGQCPARISVKAPEEHFSLEEDNLQEMVFEVVNKSRNLNNVPVTLTLSSSNISAIICKSNFDQCFLDGIILQLITMHSGSDLKLVFFTSEEKSYKWKYVKSLPHCWSDDRQVRFFASNLEEIKEISSYLEEQFKIRAESQPDPTSADADVDDDKRDKYKVFSPYYVIITDNYRIAKDTTFMNLVLNAKLNRGFSVLIFENSMQHLPTRCETFVQVLDKESCVFEKELNSKLQKIFVAEYNPTINMEDVCQKIANIPLLTKDAASSLPTSLSFLEMYNVSKIEQLNILNKWQQNNPVSNLATPIGVHTNGELFKLDLHEKFHGPHGLIAGSTGSGKSEFIITFILSMAVNYHPYEVQFVLIDYKGGGLAGAFENKETGVKIPHLVGTITNLDTSEMNRTLVSIESEMKRRQKKFNAVRDSLGEGTIDIYKYQKFYREGVVKEPMAHLFIISDEFAELKAQQPEFMQQLISTARIGRSLGIHLILATQKPSGVVNDQIWSNSKFKICLKVQDRSDSMEMLKKPDAASIKETGRFYLQVGYDDYFDIGQSGWGGAQYVPTDTVIKKVDDSLVFVNNIGSSIKSINDGIKKEQTVSTVNLGDQLTNTVKYIYNLAQKEQINTSKLWLDAIPAEIFINDLKKKYNYRPVQYVIAPLIGEYDNPKEQEQGLLNLNMTKEGNVLIYGQNGSGKENLLSTIIWSSMCEHSPSEVNYYIIDCGAESLKMFHKIPHVGEVITIDEANKMVDLFMMIEEELNVRKDLYADYAGSYITYCENSGNKMPLIVVIINNYEIFSENYAKYADNIQPYIRDGSKYGILFIITASTTAGVRGRMAQNFGIKITMQLPNDGDYRNVLESPVAKGLFPAKIFGRGLITKDNSIYEFQTAYICDKKNITNAVRSAAEQLKDAYQIRAKKIPSIPDVVALNLVTPRLNGLSQVPIGYNMENKEIETYNFVQNKFNQILADDISAHLSFIRAVIKEFAMIPKTKVVIIDLIKLITDPISNVLILSTDLDNNLMNLNNQIMSSNSEEERSVYIFTGIGQIKTILNKGSRQILNNIFMSADRLNNITFVFIDSYNSYKQLQVEEWYQSQLDASYGIWMGENVGSQMAIKALEISIEEKNITYPGMLVSVANGKYSFVKCVVDEVGVVDEK